MKTKYHAATIIATTFCAISMSLGQTVTNVTQATTHGSIQDAVATANTDDTLTLSGVFDLTTNISLNKRLVLDGGDASITKIRGNNTLPSIGGGKYFIYLTGAGAGSTISNITFEKTDKTGVQNMIGLQTGNVTFDTCTFTGQYVLGEPDVSRAFEFSGSASNFLITGCTFESLRQPGYINAGATGLIENSYVNNTRGWVIAGAAIQFNGNSWGTNAADIAILAGTPFGAPYDPLFVLSANNNAPLIEDQRVGINPYTVANLTKATAHTSIQDAINGADPGDTIEAGVGTYTEGPISLNKAVTLLGPNAGVAGDAARGAEARIQNSKITVTAAATIDGFEIYQTDNTADAVLVQAAATVTNSVVRRDGISTGTIARGITTAVGTTGYAFSGNLFSGDPSGGFFSNHVTWNSGLWLNGGSGSVTGNTFENCRTALNADDFSANITINGNTFRTSGSYLAFGGSTPTDGQFAIVGNEFFFDWVDPVTNWLPSAFFNNSNVAATFRLDVTGNTFGDVATAALSNNQKFAIEARNFHRGRSGRNGVVDFVANEQVVMPGTTVQSAVNAAATGNSVLVGPGTFTGNVSIGKALTLSGSGAGSTTLVGVSDTPLGSVQLLPNAGLVTIEGVSVIGIDGPPGLEKAAIYLQGNQSDVTLRNNTITANGDAALMAEWGGVVSNLTIENNLINGSTFNPPGTGGTAGDQFSTPNWPRSLVYIGGPGKTGIVFTGNTVDGVSGDSNNSNVMINLDATGADISGNIFEGDTGSRSGVAILRARGSNTSIEDNTFTGLSAVAIVIGSGSSDTAATSSVQENGFIAPFVAALVNAGASTLDATRNYWGAATGPEEDGSPVFGNVSFSPWYADEARTILVTAANFQDVTIPAGSSVTETDLFIGAGATYTVLGSLAVTGDLTLTDGAVLEVINGSLTINGSTLSGSFTFFNSLGSINFNDDVSITGSAEGLILISDVHVADGATITVDGTLVIDGCVVDCQDPSGSFTLQINDGATFTMARTVFVNGNLVVESADTAIYDNRFESSTVAVDAGASAARVFHNLTDDLDWLSGTAVTLVDGWGNVSDAAGTNNNLALDLDISSLTDGQTQDGDGNVYVRPGNLVTSSLDVSALQTEIAAVEVMLGYNTGLLATPGLVANANWDAQLASNFDNSTTIGLIDHAFGYTLSIEDPSAGSNADQPIATVALTAGLDEGETLFFQRVKLASDVFGGETRLTTGGASPAFLTPFTSNSSMITIDGTVPLIADPTVYATIEQFNDDVNTVTTSTAVTIQGDVDITAAAFDALAGIEDAKAEVTLVGPATYTATQTGISAGPTIPTIGGDDYTTYAYTYTVDATTLNGTYDVVFTVTDRSGNQTVETLGSILINKNQVVVNVELEGLAAGPLNRDVVLVFTDIGGNLIETRTEAIEFTGGVGSVALTDVDDASYRLSAKTAWNLRKRLDVELDSGGQAVVDFTGTNELPGGDINGGIPGDNVVNTLDYSVLRFHWFKDVTLVPAAAVADINGDGVINATDYAILQSNFYQAGDPQ